MATLIVSFLLRSPELSAEFERMMAGDREVDLGALDTMSDWRLTRPVNVPGQPSEPPDYVLIAEITEVDPGSYRRASKSSVWWTSWRIPSPPRSMLVLERVP